MVGEIWFYSLLYGLFTLVVIFPPDELVSAGITVEAILGSWLGSQLTGFVQYHVRRTTSTVVAHSLLVPGYVAMLMKTTPWIVDWTDNLHPFAIYVVVLMSLLPVTLALSLAWHWHRDNWHRHPLCKVLSLYAPVDIRSPNAWVLVASEINTEFRRIDKFSSKESSICRVVATDSWMIKLTVYNIFVTRHRDAVMSLEQSVDHFSLESRVPTQYLTINVTSVREGVKPFTLRLTGMEYSELERKIINPVVNVRQVVVQQSLSDRFLQAFTETVMQNPSVVVTQDLDLCIGCMAVPANTKLERRCGIVDGSAVGNGCTQCSCRPLWCLTCMSKWFAARQDQDQPETWLSSRAPCPTCRSPFCLLDIATISTP